MQGSPETDLVGWAALSPNRRNKPLKGVAVYRTTGTIDNRLPWTTSPSGRDHVVMSIGLLAILYYE
jgi:hypothetical protein